MRSFVILTAAAVAAAIPAVAADQGHRLDEMRDQWAAISPAPLQSDWEESQWEEDAQGADALARRPLAVAPIFTYAGDGWPLLDGWMRGDPTLRYWVMHNFDADADGWLSGSEGRLAQRTFYSIADANHSGRITSEEFVTGWTAVRRELLGFYAFDDRSTLG